MSTDKDQLIVSMFEELKKLRELNEKLQTKVEELSRSPPPPVSSVPLSQLLEQRDKAVELSSKTKDTLDKTVDLILRYAKETNFH